MKNMKQRKAFARACVLALMMAAVSGCGSEVDNPILTGNNEEISLKNFSNTGCKRYLNSRTRADEEEVVSSIELTATEKGGVWVMHNDVILNCGIRDYNVSIEVDGNKITVTETGDASLQTWCNCNIDFGYEIGPLVEGTTYELIVISEHNRSANKSIRFVYTPTLKYVE